MKVKKMGLGYIIINRMLRNKKIKVSIVFVLSMFMQICNQCLAGQGEMVQTINNTSGIIAGGVLQVIHPQQSALSGITSTNTSRMFYSKVRLIYGRENLTDLASAPNWTLQVHYKLDFYDTHNNLVKTVDWNDLKIQFDKTGATSVYEAMEVFKSQDYNYGNIKLTIEQADFSITNPPSDIRLELALVDSTVFDLPAIPSFVADYNNNQVFWSYQKGAESYQLEWVYIDDQETASISVPSDAFFVREPVRITTANHYYQINLTYPSGKIFYRLRAVGYLFNTSGIPQERYTSWLYPLNQPMVINSTSIASLAPFQLTQNWQYVTSYAEGGKYKKVISYYDGSIRKRQVLTNISSDSTVVVADSKYDKEGRETVNMLPTPLKGSDLSLRTNFNTFPAGINSYDNAFETTPNDALSDGSQTAAYYSAANNVEILHKDYIPDAQGYPFVVKQYLKDGTGRVWRQNSPGSTYVFQNPDNGVHYTEYMYGNPNPTELYRLFGSNVGNVTHYKKNAVIDPNGQISVSILDQENRVVATSLAGNAPTNIQKLDDNVSADLTVSLDEANVKDFNTNTSTIVSKIDNFVKNTNYHFVYSMTGVINQVSQYSTICKECTYDLKMYILGPKGDTLKPITIRRNISPTTAVTCGGTNSYDVASLVDTNYTFARIGEYTVVKELTLSTGGINTFLSNLTSVAGYPDSATYVNNELSTVNYSSCDISCADRCKEKVLFDNPTWAKDQVTYASNIANAINTCLASSPCNTSNLTDNTKCKSALLQMQQQLSPDGLYYTNITEMQNAYTNSGTWTIAKPSLTDLMNPLVFNLPGYGDQWITYLVTGHKEYCHYTYNCITNAAAVQASDNFEIQMALVSDWVVAKPLGYLLPYAIDPFMQAHTASQTKVAQTMQNYMTSYLQFGQNGNPAVPVTIVKNPDSPYPLAPVGDVWDFVSSYLPYSSDPTYKPTAQEEYRLFRSIYQGLKVNEQAALESAVCPYLSSSEAVYPSPVLAYDMSNPQANYYQTLASRCMSGCPQNVSVWMTQLRNSYGKQDAYYNYNLGLSVQDSLALVSDLNSYCLTSCGSQNPFGVVLLQDVATNPSLMDASRILTNYGATLSPISIDDPYIPTCFDNGKRVVSQCTYKLIDLMNDYIGKINSGNFTTVTTCPDPTTWQPGQVIFMDGNYSVFYYFDPSCWNDQSCQRNIISFSYSYALDIYKGGGNFAYSWINVFSFSSVHSYMYNIFGSCSPALGYTGSCSNLDYTAEYTKSAFYFAIERTLPVLDNLYYPTGNTPLKLISKISNPLINNYANCELIPTSSCGLTFDVYRSDYNNQPTRAQVINYGPTVFKWVDKPTSQTCIVNGIEQCPGYYDPLNNCLFNNQPIYLTSCAEKVISGLNALLGKYNDPPVACTDPIYTPFNINGGTFLYKQADVLNKNLQTGFRENVISLDVECNGDNFSSLMLLVGNDNIGKDDYFLLFNPSRDLDFAGDWGPCNPGYTKYAPYRTWQQITFYMIDYPWTNLTGKRIVYIKDPRIDCNYLNNAFKLQYPYNDIHSSGGVVVTLGYMDDINQLQEVNAYINSDGFNYGPHSLMWKTYGADYTGIQTLCDQTEPVAISDMVTQCKTMLRQKAIIEGAQNWKDAVSAFTNNALQQYYNNCFSSPLAEHLKYTYTSNEYHYTLYYYDQAGNLVQTVPPSGVKPLGSAAFNSSDGNYIAGNEPQHTLISRYQYNSLNQLISQNTPDGGDTYLFYDSKNQLRLSQNANQYTRSSATSNVYSYTKYDPQGRIIEVGEVTGFNKDRNFLTSKAKRKAVLALLDNSNTPLSSAATGGLSIALSQVTHTTYDIGQPGQDNLRGRVVSTNITNTSGNPPDAKTLYSYDPHGNVKHVTQQVANFQDKITDYTYDLISGKVNSVVFQQAKPDQFIHTYQYDADNRITSVKTSSNGYLWEEDAHYFYFRHGPLARVEMGEDKVQGMDYQYTLQGWLKGVNTPAPQALYSGNKRVTVDPGSDGLYNSPVGVNNYVQSKLNGKHTYTNLHRLFAQDEFAYNLSYYQGDYNPIAGSQLNLGVSNPFGSPSLTPAILQNGLYNGNIVSMTTEVHSLGSLGNPNGNISVIRGQCFQYDQLNRLAQGLSFYYPGATGTGWTARSTYSPNSSDFDFAYKYDPNGNILTARTNSLGATPLNSLSYQYDGGNSGAIHNNKLQSVSNTAPVSANTDQFPSQAQNNYSYDAIGNLTSDIKGEIARIDWTVYGKISKITRTTGSTKYDLEFAYDAIGQRVVKIDKPKDASGNLLPSTQWSHTYYARDASGNVMGIYNEAASAVNVTTEFPVYGSSRLGEYNKLLPLAVTSNTPVTAVPTVLYPGYTYNAATDLVLTGSGWKNIPSGKRAFVRAGNTFKGGIQLNSGATLIVEGNYNTGWIQMNAGSKVVVAPGGSVITGWFQLYGVTCQNWGTLQTNGFEAGTNGVLQNYGSFSSLNNWSMTTDYTNGRIENYGTIAVTGYAGMECKHRGTILNMGTISLNNGPFNVYQTGIVLNKGTITTGNNINVYGGTLDNRSTLTSTNFFISAGLLNLVSGSQVTTANLTMQTNAIIADTSTDNGYANIKVTGSSTLLSASMSGRIMYCAANGIGQNTISVGKGVIFGCNVVTSSMQTISRIPEAKSYELSNHLGNVYAVIPGLKLGRDTTSNGINAADYYTTYPVVVNDYYPFGMNIASRSYSSASYRYGFNGKEKDLEEMSSGGSTYDYGARIYNPALGRFLSVDPIARSYSELTPYQFASNTPIQADDIDGLEARKRTIHNEDGSTTIKITADFKLLNSTSTPNRQISLKLLKKAIAEQLIQSYAAEDKVGNIKYEIEAVNITPVNTVDNEKDYYIELRNPGEVLGEDNKVDKGSLGSIRLNGKGNTEVNRIQVEYTENYKKVAKIIAHEFGHTIGLAHVGTLDDQQKNIMKNAVNYEDNLRKFKNAYDHCVNTLESPKNLMKVGGQHAKDPTVDTEITQDQMKQGTDSMQEKTK